MAESYFVNPADLSWRNEAPFSKTYQDIYWSAENSSPLAEKREVFVKPFQQFLGQCEPGSQITICDLGFGFGINCLLATEMWHEQKNSTCRLNLISIEKHPIKKEDLTRFLLGFDFSSSDRLLDQYPPNFRGQHVIWLASNVRLLLIFDDINDALGNLDAQVDFWFLDGFSPEKNKAMWLPENFMKIFSLSRPGAEVATYTAAGTVRRALEYAGFETRKIRGFGRKRERLSARKPGEWQPAKTTTASISIIGSGLAGFFCAEALSKRGINFTIIDSGIPGPSNIPQLAVMPQVALKSEPKYRFSFAACQYMQSVPGYKKTGVLHERQTYEEIERLLKIAAQFPNEIIEFVNNKMIMYEAGWLAFEETKRHIPIQTHRAKITSIRQEDQWLCLSGEKIIASSDKLVLATGFDTKLLPEELEVRTIGGHAVSVKTKSQNQVINNGVTVFPTYKGRSVISGTYEREPKKKIDPILIDSLMKTAKKISEFDEKTAEPWLGRRTAARDRFPIVGQAPCWEELKKASIISRVNLYQQGLYYCTAFGSRGATHARLAAEHLVSKMIGEPAAVGLKEQKLMSPFRFTIRNRKPIHLI